MSVKKVLEFEKNGFIPVNRPDLQPYPMSIPFNWAVDPYNDSNWCFQLNTLRYLMIYLGAYNETKDKEYILKLIKWIENWWAFIQKNNIEFAWHDMATGIRSEKIQILFEACDNNNIDKPYFFQELVNKHLEVMMSEGFFRSNHNHGLYVIHGIRCLAELIDDNKEVIEFCEKGWDEILENQLDESFIHKEHSPHYHFLFVETLDRYLKTNFYDNFPKMHNCFSEAKKNCDFLTLPDGREIPFGDTDNALSRKPKYKIPSSEKLTLSGYFVYKDCEDLTYLALTNSYHSTVHKHWDNLSFIFGYKGQDILMDPGKYKYDNSDNIRKSVIESKSHNTVNINGLVWGRRNLIKNSLRLIGKIDKKGIVKCFSRIALETHKKKILINRNMYYYQGFLKIKDTVDIKGNYYSIFILNKDAKLLKINNDGSYIYSFNETKVSFKFLSDDERVVLPTIINTPVSYSYGSYHNSITLKVNFNKTLDTEVQIL